MFVACLTDMFLGLFFTLYGELYPCQHGHIAECTKWARESLVPEVFPVFLRCPLRLDMQYCTLSIIAEKMPIFTQNHVRTNTKMEGSIDVF